MENWSVGVMEREETFNVQRPTSKENPNFEAPITILRG
jgi:hypothetical protein